MQASGSGAGFAFPARTPGGLEGRWKFDEGSGTSTTDSSGNGNGGTLSGGVTWTAGRSGSALLFDGQTGSVAAGVSGMPAANAAQSISWWMNYSSIAGTQDAICLSDSAQGSSVQCGFRNGQLSVWNWGGNALVSTVPPSLNAWHHFAYTFDGTTHRLYVDGGLAATGTGAPQTMAPTELVFGTTPGWPEFFAGSLDEVHVYARTLSAGEVAGLAQDPTLEAWFTFDEGQGIAVGDSSGLGHDGTLQGGGTWAAGELGSALLFDGTSGTVSGTLGTGLPAASAPQTVSWWMNVPSNPSGTQAAVSLTNNSLGSAVQCGFQGGQAAVWQYGGTTLVSAAAPAAGAWHHYAYSFDGSNHRLYMDGSLAASSTVAAQTGGPSRLDLGSVPGQGQFYAGALDELRIYSRTLSAAEVLLLANPLGPQAYYRFEEAHGLVTRDQSGHGHDGTLNGGITWTTGHPGSAIALDGTSGNVSCALGTGLPANNAPQTIAWWMSYPTVPEGTESVVGLTNPDVPSGVQCGFRGGLVTVWKWGGTPLVAADAPPADGWHHVAYTFDGTTHSLYVDGTLVDTSTAAPETSAPSRLDLGFTPGWGEYYEGALDEVRIYGRALSAGDVAALVRPTGLQAYFKFNEGAGGAAADSSGNGHAGTLTDATWGPGKEGTALVLDGTDDFVTCLVGSGLPSAGASQTVSWWMNVAQNPSASQCAIDLHNDGAGSAVQCGFRGGNVAVWKNGGSILVQATPPAAGAWHHLAYTFDGTTHRLYVDGALSASGTATPDAAAVTSFVLGRTNGTASDYFAGALDEVRIYSRALSDAQVALLAQDPALVAYFKFDEGAGTTAADSSGGGGHDGTLVGGTSWTAGQLGGAVLFDGQSGYVAALPGTGLPANNAAQTIACWMNFPSSGGVQDAICLSNEASASAVQCGFRNGQLTIWNWGGNTLVQTAPPSLNAWHHVAYTFDGTTHSLYVDGTLAATGNAAPQAAVPSDFAMGYTAGWGEYYQGALDDVRVYTRTLSAAEIQALAQPGAPPAPANLVAAPGNSQVTLSWNASSGATSYKVFRSTASGNYGAPVATGLTQTSFVDPGLTNGQTYFYVVKATSGAGDSGPSNEVSATPVPAPAPPTGLTAQPGNAQVVLTWNVTAGATSYTLKRSATLGGPYSPVQTGIPGTSATDTGLSNGTTYYYVVTALSPGGESGNSNEVPATPGAPPAAPAGLTASGRNTAVLLTWAASPGAVSYSVKRSSVTGGPYMAIAPGLTGTLYVDRGLTNGTTYYYVVSATSAAGEGPSTAEAAGTPQAPPNAPSGLTASPGNVQITLGWTAVAGVASYDILRSAIPGGPYTSVGTAAGLAYTDTGLTNGVAYYYVVHSILGATESGDSIEAYAVPTLGPPAPENLVATPGSSQVALSWSASTGATLYTIARSQTSGGPYTSIGTTTGTTFLDGTATNGTAYYYVVIAQNGGGQTQTVSQVSAIPISYPSNVLAIPDSTPEVALSWTAVSGGTVTGYSVYRGSQTGGPYSLLNPQPLTSTTYLDTGVSIGVTYFYIVRAVDGQGHESGNSSEVPATPVNPSLFGYGNALTADSIDWRWYYVTLDPSWVKYQLLNGNTPVFTSNDTSVTDYVETGLLENTSYSRRVTALTATGTIPPSDPFQAYTLVHDTTADDFAVSAGPGPGTVTITITPPPHSAADLTGATIWRDSGSGFVYVQYLQGTYTFTDTGLTPGSPYRYQIYYTNGDGVSSGASPAKSIGTAPIPTGLAGQAQSVSSIFWTWQAVPGASSYILADLQNTTVATPTGTSALDGGLAENTLYTRTVAAVDAGGTEPASPPASRYTAVHDGSVGDFSVTVTGATSAQVVVVPPPGSASGSTGCEISRSVDGTTWTVARAFASTYTFTDTILVGGGAYYYRIRFQNGDGIPGGYSPAVQVQTPAGPAAAPGSFAGIAVSSSQIHWTWQDVPGSSGFVLQNDAGQTIATVGPGVLSYDESGLPENARTSRHVRALSSGFPGQASPSVAVITLVHNASAADFSVIVYTQNQITISVQPPPQGTSGQTGCEIDRLAGGTWSVVQPFAPVYLFSDSGLSPGTSYAYRIRFRNGGGIPSGFSSNQSAMTFSSAPPIITTPSKITRSTIPLVAGTSSPGETITVFFGGLADGTTVATSSGIWLYTASPQSLGTYAVVAYGSASGYSNTITIQIVASTLPPPLPPKNLRSKVYSTAIDLEWDPSPSSNVAGYNVYRGSSATGPWTVLNQGVVLNTKYRDSGVTLGQAYYYQVTAVDNTVRN